MSVTRPTLNAEVAVVVDAVELAFFEEPQPAAATARTNTSMTIGSFFTALSEVLDCGTKTVSDSTWHTTVGVVLRARDGRLEVLLAEGALPAAPLARGESLEAALARAVDDGALAHLEQLETRVRADGDLVTAYLGLARSDAELDGEWSGAAVCHARSRRRGSSSRRRRAASARSCRTPTSASRSHRRRSRSRSSARSTWRRSGTMSSATNLQRVLLRRGVLERIEGLRPSGRSGGRPAAVFRFASQRLEVTDAFATLRPPR